MHLFAREPIFDKDNNIFAYQFIYRNGINGSFPMEFSLMSSEDENKGLNIDDLLQVKHTIVNVLPDLLEDFSTTFSGSNVLVELSEMHIAPSTRMLELIFNMKKLGFGFILNSTQLQWERLIPFCDYVKVNVGENAERTLAEVKQIFGNSKVKIIATNVHSHFQFEQCRNLPADFFQGFYFLDVPKHNDKPVPTNKLAYLQLMSEVAKPELDIEALENTFKKDPTLSYLLIKFINNPLVNKSHKITSIRHAINYLGELMLRRFVAIISLAGLNSRQPQELLNLSLSRAKFCEILDAEMHGISDAMSAFLVGLFSLIDVILNKEMVMLLEKLELDDAILSALLKHEGNFANILGLAKSIESGNWNKFFTLSVEVQLEKEHIFDIHRRAVRWQYDMTDAISPLFPKVNAKAT